VIAPRHEHQVAVANRDRDVETVRRTVEPLNGERFGTLGAVVVHLLEHDLARRFVLIVLVRGVARPVTGGREDLDHEESLGGKLGLEDVVDLPSRVPRTPDLDFDFLGSDEHRFAPSLAARAADGELEPP
jgi:hypothetical protein